MFIEGLGNQFEVFRVEELLHFTDSLARVSLPVNDIFDAVISRLEDNPCNYYQTNSLLQM